MLFFLMNVGTFIFVISLPCCKRESVSNQCLSSDEKHPTPNLSSIVEETQTSL